MVIYDPIFGIYFLPPFLNAAGRMHIEQNQKEPDDTGDLLNLDSDAEHQSEKSEHPV